MLKDGEHPIPRRPVLACSQAELHHCISRRFRLLEIHAEAKEAFSKPARGFFQKAGLPNAARRCDEQVGALAEAFHEQREFDFAIPKLVAHHPIPSRAFQSRSVHVSIMHANKFVGNKYFGIVYVGRKL